MNRKVGTLYPTNEWLIVKIGNLGGNTESFRPIFEYVGKGLFYVIVFYNIKIESKQEENHVRFKIRKGKSRDC